MIYKHLLPSQAIHLDIHRSGNVDGRICFFEQHPATNPKSCNDCFPHGQENVCHYLLALPLSCWQVRAEVLPIYQAKIFIIRSMELPRVYRSLAVCASSSSIVPRFNPIRRLQLNFLGDPKLSGSQLLAKLRAECLSAIVKNEVGANEICAVFQRQASSLSDRFPLTKSTIIALGKLRGLKTFRLHFQDGIIEGPGMLTSKLKFQRKVKIGEEILREFACLGKNGDVSGLDQEARKMTKSDNQFFLGFRAKLDRGLLERYGISPG